ncbi:Lrp/AsnC family transcriptional regulator [Rhizobium paknamense]|uniref:Lrp/AsnC family leucine-responsive transcriptional regulator n=1 Tax=Rhizobium paknamense TaxID=1206817 RepID=A0ABU0ICX3_9HYPH|nr:Lrp/AsnC family transcriptional regulator [Rhizobium paknamense]MDQ0456094.1 Lrp/AsnC family leucine-responsive transcriptional regulator [Rhizobium paknamense]
MDQIDRKILDLLVDDSRRSLAEIGEGVGLSPSSVNDRIRRLTQQGVVKRFTVEVDHAKIGLPITAFVFVQLHTEASEEAFRAFAASHAAVEECHHLTGGWSYLLKLRLRDLQDIETFLAETKSRRFLARSETMISLSAVAEKTCTGTETA